VKAPRVGRVKTRLAAAIGARQACAAYRLLTRTLLGHLSELAEVELRYTPDEAAPEIEPWRRAGWQSQPQGCGDLGTRLQRAFADAFQNSAERVAIIGSDCPEVTAQDIDAAWSALKTFDVALGPARDGGYWLIGLRQPQPELFDGLAWSTSAVLPQTLQRAHAAGLSVHLLRKLADVDCESDWREFRARSSHR
jgi:hypothetical protein